MLNITYFKEKTREKRQYGKILGNRLRFRAD